MSSYDAEERHRRRGKWGDEGDEMGASGKCWVVCVCVCV
jgi:hypothetical protein